MQVETSARHSGMRSVSRPSGPYRSAAMKIVMMESMVSGTNEVATHCSTYKYLYFNSLSSHVLVGNSGIDYRAPNLQVSM
jgi:hypothetical protein